MKTILIVDDEAILRANLCEMLTFEGFDAIEAGNGVEAIAITESALPDLVICDVAMPEMDGFEVVTRLKSNPKTAHIPVLILTAQAEKASIEHGLRIGAADYILKPFSFRDVLIKVAQHVDNVG